MGASPKYPYRVTLFVFVTIFDGYVDEPALLGVPPYISPYPRLIAGVLEELEIPYEYITVDMWREGARPRGDVLVVTGGAIVPGRYLRGMPASVREIADVASAFKGVKIIGGPLVRFGITGRKDVSSLLRIFDHVVSRDLEAFLYELLGNGTPEDRWRTGEEWSRWLTLGAPMVRGHPDHGGMLIAEIETSRGCPRYISGGCSFCTEPLYGKPVFRPPEDIIGEIKALWENGVRHFRIGGQSCIFSYMAHGVGERERVRPNPGALRRLFQGIWKVAEPDVLHVDNANPAVMAEHEREAMEILDILVKYTTPGNVLALGMESADPVVIEANNLNAQPEEVMRAIEMVNEVGRERGENGMPRLLPGLNFLLGLRGERRETYTINMEFLRDVMRRGLLLRRINVRKVVPVRGEFRIKSTHLARKFRDEVRREIERKMLRDVVPWGTVLRNVWSEVQVGGYTYCRQVGTYPLTVVLPYRVPIGIPMDVKVVAHGDRSVTAVRYPVDPNTASLSELKAVPGVGEKRAARIIRMRPFHSMSEISSATGLSEEELSAFMSLSSSSSASPSSPSSRGGRVRSRTSS